MREKYSILAETQRLRDIKRIDHLDDYHIKRTAIISHSRLWEN
jgi:hypothetical protein